MSEINITALTLVNLVDCQVLESVSIYKVRALSWKEARGNQIGFIEVAEYGGAFCTYLEGSVSV